MKNSDKKSKGLMYTLLSAACFAVATGLIVLAVVLHSITPTLGVVSGLIVWGIFAYAAETI